MLIVVVAALFGIWRCRTSEYFKWLAVLFVWMLAAAILFWGGGTLQNPSADGLITREIRRATNDGPAMGIYALVFLVIYWSGAGLFLSKLFRKYRAARMAEDASYDDPDWVDGPDITSRQTAETVLLLVAAGVWIWFVFILPKQEQLAQSQGSIQSSDETRQDIENAASAPMTVEQDLLGAAAEVNSTLPKTIGDFTLMKATASGRTLTYHYRVESNLSPTAVHSFILRRVLPKACTGPTRKDMNQLGVSYEYSYDSGPKLTAPVSMVVNERTCTELEK
jgi:hypothetical protein